MGIDTKKDSTGLEIAADQLLEAAKARKCWACNCLGSTLSTIDKAVPKERQTSKLQESIEAAKTKVLPQEIECRGCDICFPAIALNALADVADPEALEAAACPAEDVTPRDGWPPLAGNYTALGFQRSVAICTLNNEDLWGKIVATQPESVAVVGMLNTENLGIERLIQNITANPNIRFLILCGEDSKRKVGHLPGQSLLALSKNGIGDRHKIIGAKGRRPVLRNIESGMIDHFIENVEIIDMIGEISVDRILSVSASHAEKNPIPSATYLGNQTVSVVSGTIPDRMVSDPNGYFVIYPDQKRGIISLEHFSNDGVLTTLIEGKTASELYHPTIERKLLSRLDHACYLGRELARAEQSIKTGEKYTQDAAPERIVSSESCGCSNECK